MRRRVGVGIAAVLGVGAIGCLLAARRPLAALRLLARPVARSLASVQAGPALLDLRIRAAVRGADGQSADDETAALWDDRSAFEAFETYNRVVNHDEWYLRHRVASARTFDGVDGAGAQVVVQSGRVAPLYSLIARRTFEEASERTLIYTLLPGDPVLVAGCLARRGDQATMSGCDGGPLLLTDDVARLRASLKTEARPLLLLSGMCAVLAALLLGLSVGPRPRRTARFGGEG